MEEGKLYSNQEGNKVVYPSKVGLELLVPIILIFAILFVSTFEKASLIGVVLQFGLMFGFVALFFSISYEVTDEVLSVISFFFIKKNILIKDITRIVESNNPIS